MKNSTSTGSDFLVIGGGIAGLIFAIKASAVGSVTVLTKAASDEANTAYAQGGIASVWSVDDSFESHIEDTLRSGAGLCNRAAVEAIVRDGPEAVRELIALGTHFTRVDEGGEDEYDLGREGGHSHRRVLHAQDLTGREIMRALGEAAKARPNIRVLENHVAVNLLIERDANRRPQACWGVYALDKATMSVHKVVARATLLATGGAGKVYLYTTNPDIASGDGVAMAYRAGAPIANMEFYQFHPTCLYHPAAKSFLISEALRGEGAILRLPDGTPFPTLYYLTDPRLTAEASRQESAGVMREMTERLATDPELAAAYRLAHESYLAERDEIESLGTEFTGGGMPERVKCLHVLIAHALAKGPGVNPFGDEAVALAADNGLRGTAVPADWPKYERTAPHGPTLHGRTPHGRSEHPNE